MMKIATKNPFAATAVAVGCAAYSAADCFLESLKMAISSGKYFGMLMDRMNLLNHNTPSMIGFSLGSLLLFEALITIYDQGSPLKVGDVCLLGSVVHAQDFYDNIHKLIGTKGVVQGKLTVVWSSNDSILWGFFRTATMGKSPIGLNPINTRELQNKLRMNDPYLSTRPSSETFTRVSERFDNLDASTWVSGHSLHVSELQRTLEIIQFNNDAKYFYPKC